MAIRRTPYKIKLDEPCSHSVVLNGRTVASGFFDVESALKAIWVLAGSHQNEFYHFIDDAVVCEILEDKIV